MPAYGNFLSAFPELHRRIKFRNGKTIRAVLVHTLKAEAFREADFNTAGDVSFMYVSTRQCSLIDIGDRFVHPEYGYEMRLVGKVPYNMPAGYTVFTCERVTTPDSTQVEGLGIRQATFD